MKKDLLHTPEGVRDIYSTECVEKKIIENRLHNVCKLYGYNDIQTPSIEYFDVFSKERGSVPSNEMFKLFDRYGNTLVLRPDMTPSIARAAAKYFEDPESQALYWHQVYPFLHPEVHMPLTYLQDLYLFLPVSYITKHPCLPH